jgi:hypothetical protein
MKKKEINVFFNLKDKALNRIYVNKDSTEAHFSIYVEKYQTKKKTETKQLLIITKIRDRNSVGTFYGKLY